MHLKQTKLKNPVELHTLTTIKIGGCARLFFLVNEASELRSMQKYCRDNFYILGNGSNILVRDGLLEAPVVKLGKNFCYVKESEGLLEVGASTPLSFLIKYCLKNNISLAEKLIGIPATIGGMLAMNASSLGYSLSSQLKEVEISDLKGGVSVLTKDKIRFAYRHSSVLEEKSVILRARFHIKKGDNLRAVATNNMKVRLAGQDFSFPSCGSVFKNPEAKPAGLLIESCGFKGLIRGGAQVSEKHANFIINKGGASYNDVDFLIKAVKEGVFKKYNIMLEEEIQRWK